MKPGTIFYGASRKPYLVTSDLHQSPTGESVVVSARSIWEEGTPLRALKIHTNSRDPNEKVIAFENELETLKLLNNSHNGNPYRNNSGVVRLYDFSMKDLFLVLEYVDGRSLDLLMQGTDKGNFSVLETLALTSQISKTLSEILGKYGVVHRDFKPDNVLIPKPIVSRLGRNSKRTLKKISRIGGIKLCDFSLSLTNGQSKLHDLTERDGLFLGTPYYCPPEVVRGGRGGSSTDVWALGITTYEMLTQTSFFFGSSHEDILYEIANYNVPRLIRRNLFGFEDFLYSMLERAPEHRPRIDEVHSVTKSFYEKLVGQKPRD